MGGDFFWISALREVLPGLDQHIRVTREVDRYPSFFVVKDQRLAGMLPRDIAAEAQARKVYADRSRYFALWRSHAALRGETPQGFLVQCRESCGGDCSDRVRRFTPTRSAGSTLRPFACKEESPHVADTCAAEMLVDVKAYHDVCRERCNVTCQQRSDLFSQFGDEILTV